MRILFAAVALALLAAPAHADTMVHCAANWKAMAPADKAKTTYRAYSSECMKGGAATTATAPAATTPATPVAAAKPATARATKTATVPAAGGPAPAGATGQCKDGTYTMSKTHSGSCSHHGGVAKWL